MPILVLGEILGLTYFITLVVLYPILIYLIDKYELMNLKDKPEQPSPFVKKAIWVFTPYFWLLDKIFGKVLYKNSKMRSSKFRTYHSIGSAPAGGSGRGFSGGGGGRSGGGGASGSW